MKNRMFTLGCGLIASVFWFFDSSMHYFLYGEPRFEIIPSDFNELWMRAVIVLLIIVFGIYSDHFTNNIVTKEKQLEVARTYNGMIHASLQILVNLLNQMELFKLEAQRSKDFDQNIIAFYDQAIDETRNLVDTLSRLYKASECEIGAPPDLNNLFHLCGDSKSGSAEKSPG